MKSNCLFLVTVLISMLLAGCSSTRSTTDASTTVLSGSAESHSVLFDQLAVLPNAPQAAVMVGLINGGQETVAVVGNSELGEDSLFEFGSVTKVLTAITLGQFAEEGRLNIDDPLNQHLPANLQDEKWETVTLQQIASHSAGLPRMPGNYLSLRTFLSQGDPISYSDAKLAKAMADVELSGVGEERLYSNFGFGILGAMVEETGDADYAELIQARIFDAYGMETASIHGWRGDDIAPPLTKAGRKGGNWDFDAMESAGAARGSILDGLALLRASMTACERDDLASRGNCLAQQSTTTVNGWTIGLAWLHTDDGTIWHNGGTGGYQTFVGFNSAENRGIVLLVNSSGVDGLDQIAFDWLSTTND